jgi:hypothetical protein
MIIQKSKDKSLQFDANLEKIIFRTFEKRSKNSSCERTVLYIQGIFHFYICFIRKFMILILRIKIIKTRKRNATYFLKIRITF